MEKLKPKLFSVMKTYSKEQFVKDIIAGIIVQRKRRRRSRKWKSKGSETLAYQPKSRR